MNKPETQCLNHRHRSAALASQCTVRFRPIAIGALTIFTAFAAQAAAYQDHDAIRSAARQFVGSNMQEYPQAPQIEVGQLDRRLRLTECGSALETFAPNNRKLVGNVTIGVRCRNPKPWTIYVPVSIRVFDTVVVTERMLARNTVVGKFDIAKEIRDVTSLHGRYMRTLDDALGQLASQHVPINTILLPNMLQEPKLVHRGEQITILATASGVEVRMNGTALADGSAGDRIRVRNNRSKRVVQGTVLRAGEVRVSL